MNTKSIEEFRALMKRFDPIGGQPTFTNTRELKKQVIAGAKRIEYRKCKYRYAGDVMESALYSLLNTSPWPPPDNPGAYLQLDGSKKRTRKSE